MPAKKITTVEIAAMRSEFHKGYQSISDLRFSGVREIQAISTPPQMRRSNVLPTGKTLARTEFTSDRAFQIRAPVGRQPNGTSAAMRSEFHKGYQSISDLRFSGVWEIQAISSCRKCGVQAFCRQAKPWRGWNSLPTVLFKSGLPLGGSPMGRAPRCAASSIRGTNP